MKLPAFQIGQKVWLLEKLDRVDAEHAAIVGGIRLRALDFTICLSTFLFNSQYLVDRFFNKFDLNAVPLVSNNIKMSREPQTLVLLFALLLAQAGQADYQRIKFRSAGSVFTSNLPSLRVGDGHPIVSLLLLDLKIDRVRLLENAGPSLVGEVLIAGFKSQGVLWHHLVLGLDE